MSFTSHVGYASRVGYTSPVGYLGDDGKDGLLAVPHQAQFHIVPRGDAHDLRDDERGQPDGGGQKNTFRGFA